MNEDGFRFEAQGALGEAHRALGDWLAHPAVSAVVSDPDELLELPASRALLGRPRPLQAVLAAACVERSRHYADRSRESWRLNAAEQERERRWRVDRLAEALLRRRLDFDDPSLLVLVEACARPRPDDVPTAAQVLRQVAHARQDRTLDPDTEQALRRLRTRLAPFTSNARDRRHLRELEQVLGLGRPESPALPDPGEAWSDALRADLAALDPPTRAAWEALLTHALRARGSEPGQRWRSQAAPLLEAVGSAPFLEGLRRWFPLVALARAPLGDRGADLLKGLAWTCVLLPSERVDALLADLAETSYRKLRGHGPRSAKAGNAALQVLAERDTLEAAGHLARLRRRIRYSRALDLVGAALRAAAARLELTSADLEDLGVPTFGLSPRGERRERLEHHTATLRVVGTVRAELLWCRQGVREAQEATPPEVQRAHPGRVVDLRRALKGLPQTLSAQRDRLERLFSSERTWSYPVWRERLLDHPVLQHLARRLVWSFETPGRRPRTGAFLEGELVSARDRPLQRLRATTRVRLWHPLESSSHTVRAWRRWLARHAVTQPFKQAHREVYRLEAAERRGLRTHSDRFAAAVARQQQLAALCRDAGWRFPLQGTYESDAPTRRVLPGLTAELWLEPAGEATTTTGAWTLVTAAQVRFVEDDQVPVPLTRVPPQALSELLREVDQFLSAASIGTDPSWGTGVERPLRSAWEASAFGDLGPAARIRRELLRTLAPSLDIDARCEVTERFLRLRAPDGRGYEIHLGSGNVRSSPGGTCLRVLVDRSARRRAEAVLLPFEGDGTLVRILGKAFLLAGRGEVREQKVRRKM